MKFASSKEFTDGEKKLWDRLRAAYPAGTNDWAFHCLPLHRMHGSTYVPDVLILGREIGLVIIEVKD
mgnify:CR=1 FL=1